MIIATTVMLIFAIHVGRSMPRQSVYLPWRSIAAGFLSGVVGTLITLHQLGMLK